MSDLWLCIQVDQEMLFEIILAAVSILPDIPWLLAYPVSRITSISNLYCKASLALTHRYSQYIRLC